MKPRLPPPVTQAGAELRVGLSLVEVLVALAIMATVTLALFGLQTAGLRAARAAALTRHQAAALRYEGSLARVVAEPAAGCRGTAAVGACQLTTTCLDAVALPEGCNLLRTIVVVTSPDGRSASLTTVAYAPLEAAVVGVPATAPAVDPQVEPVVEPGTEQTADTAAASGGAPR